MADFGDWATHFEATYTNKSQTSRRKRAKAQRRPTKPGPDPAQIEAARNRLRARFDSLPDRKPEASFWQFVEIMCTGSHPDFAARADAKLIVRHEMGLCYRGERKVAAAERKAAITVRTRDGIVWQGRSTKGLVSDHHPILKLFAAKLPRGQDLTVGDDKAISGPAPHRSKLLGLDAAYVDCLKSMRGVIRIEIDANLTWQQIEAACISAQIPLPNIAVGFEDADGVVWHPHLLWLLTNSVAFTAAGHVKHKKLFDATLRGLTAALLPSGADPGGIFNSMRCKNPLSPSWSRRVLAEVPYSLADLRQPSVSKLPQSNVVLTAEHPDPEVAVGSNALFRTVAGWAREHVRAVRDDAAMSDDDWAAMVKEVAEDHATTMLHTRPGDEKHRGVQRRVHRLAALVARWTWANVRPKKARLTTDEVTARQAASGWQTAATRSERTKGAIEAAIQELTKTGQKVTQAAVLAIVQRGRICSLKTVKRHWSVAE
jgi:hypothetical protein